MMDFICPKCGYHSPCDWIDSLKCPKCGHRNNFDHQQCYRDGLHEMNDRGRSWCRHKGPASQSGRDYRS
jgi:predicted ATP-dependent serine protease